MILILIALSMPSICLTHYMKNIQYRSWVVCGQLVMAVRYWTNISYFQEQGHGMFDGLVKDKELAGRRLRRGSLPQKQIIQLGRGGGLVRWKHKMAFVGSVQLVWKPAEISTASYTEVNKTSFSTALILQRYQRFCQELWCWLTKWIYPSAIGILISWKRKKIEKKKISCSRKNSLCGKFWSHCGQFIWDWKHSNTCTAASFLKRRYRVFFRK